MKKKQSSQSKSIQKRSNTEPPVDSRRTSVASYDPLDAFLNEIKQYPLLEPEEEKEAAETKKRGFGK